MAAIEKLSKTHAEHISQYGTGNEQRLTGKHETCDINTFRCGGVCGCWTEQVVPLASGPQGGGSVCWAGGRLASQESTRLATSTHAGAAACMGDRASRLMLAGSGPVMGLGQGGGGRGKYSGGGG
jgi:hypothetical protein